MKKDLFFAPLLLILGIVLFLLKATGITAHIVVASLGVLVLMAYTALTRKEWKLPALEAVFRVFYAIAMVTGVVLMNVENVAALAIAHKVSAALFVALLVILFVIKLVGKKESK